MFYRFFKNTVFIFLALLISCSGQSKNSKKGFSIKKEDPVDSIVVGANQTAAYLPLLKNKKVGIIGNQTSVIFHGKQDTHLVDSLRSLGVDIQRVFSPEHGFRGTASAGESVSDQTDEKTGIPIISLYGNHYKPTAKDLEGLDILIFDIQDVGLRFYTYLSTLHYVMEAAAEHKIPLLLLDRPNPNGSYIDGPILEKEHRSFVGMHPVPVVHGMTLGEYAQMINGEKWLKDGVQCTLTVIPVKNYNKNKPYSLPIKPSPNLPNDRAINLYPSLCFFEGTVVNAGRGTDFQFQAFGAPSLHKDYFDFQYTPKSNAGAAHPKHENEVCYGRDLRQTKTLHQINLDWLIEAYQHTADPQHFFNNFFEKLAGTTTLRQQIEKGMSGDQIRETWKPELKKYDEKRQAYLLY